MRKMRNQIIEKTQNKIIFDEKNHKYYDNKSMKELLSVTTLLSKYFPFDKDKVASEYARKHGMNKDEVLKKWEDKANYGTAMHDVLERHILKKYFNEGDGITDEEKSKIPSLSTFFEENEIKPLTTETVIGSDELEIAGQVDLICKYGEFEAILDWKTSKKLDTRGDNALEPLSHLTTGNFYKYAMQLEIYRFILNNEYGFNITHSLIAHIKDGELILYECRNFQKEVEMLLFHD